MAPATSRGRCGLSGVDAFRAGLEAGLEAAFDELVEVAVQHLLRIAALDPGDYVMVHAGLAIAKITSDDEAESAALLADTASDGGQR